MPGDLPMVSIIHIAPKDPMTSINQQRTSLGSCPTSSLPQISFIKNTLHQILSGFPWDAMHSCRVWIKDKQRFTFHLAFEPCESLWSIVKHGFTVHLTFFTCWVADNQWLALTSITLSESVTRNDRLVPGLWAWWSYNKQRINLCFCDTSPSPNPYFKKDPVSNPTEREVQINKIQRAHPRDVPGAPDMGIKDKQRFTLHVAFWPDESLTVAPSPQYPRCWAKFVTRCFRDQTYLHLLSMNFERFLVV